MRQPMVFVLLALALFVVVPQTHATAKKAAKSSSSKASSGAYLYRYRNADGVLVMESSIPPEYASKGYQILSSSGQLIQDVPPSAISEEERKTKVQGDAQAGLRDAEFRKLYSAPQDAERLRDRQLDALTIQVDHTKGLLNQSISRRKAEVEQAARAERQGNPVTAAARESIDRLTRQVNDQTQQIKALQDEQQRIRDQFAPVIERLKVIYPDKAGPAVAAPAPAAPAVVAPAVVPAVKAPAGAPLKAAPPVPGSALVKSQPPVPAPATVPAKPATAVMPPKAAPAPVAVVPAATPVPPAAAPAVVAPKVVPVAPAPVAPKPVPAKPVAPVVAPAPPVPTVPPVKPVVSTKKPAHTGPVPTDEEKAKAKAAAKAKFELDTEQRSPGGLRPTGVR